MKQEIFTKYFLEGFRIGLIIGAGAALVALFCNV
jgi:gas vesicle protein